MTPSEALVWVLVLFPPYVALVAYLTLKEYSPMSDKLSRAARTFWQAFIPSTLAIVAAKLADVKGVSDLSGFLSVSTPLVLSAASSALSLAWYSVFPPKPTTPEV